MTTNVAYKEWIAETDDTILFLDKADLEKAGKVTLDDIHDSLNEYKRLFKAGIASPAEIVTLSRAFPEVSKYANVVDVLDLTGEHEPVVVGGPASVELVDREGHLITSDALEDAFKKYMDNFRTRNVMVMHSDVQVGHALPAYISKSGQIFKSGVNDAGLFFIAELRNDTKISKKVGDQINSGKMKSYSIAGSATKTQNITKGANTYMQVDKMELAEVTICEKGVNQGAHFELMKSMPTPTQPVEEQTMYVISKGEVPTMKEVFDSWIDKAESNGLLEGKQMAVLENGNARQLHHRSLLDEMGFPKQVDAKDIHVPVDYDDPEDPTDWRVVNQSGQELGDPNLEMYKASSPLLDDPKRMTGVAKGKKDADVEKILPLVGAALGAGARAAGSLAGGAARGAAHKEINSQMNKGNVAKANGATALATQHNNPDRNRRMVQNGYWESLLVGDDLEKGIGDVVRAVGSKLGMGGKKPPTLGSTGQAGGGMYGRGQRGREVAPPTPTADTSLVGAGRGTRTSDPKTPAPKNVKYPGSGVTSRRGGSIYSKKPMSQAGAGAGPVGQEPPTTSPEFAAQTSGSAARGQAGSGGIYSRGQAGREQYKPPTRAQRAGSAAAGAAQRAGSAAAGAAQRAAPVAGQAGSAVARLGQKFGAALGSGAARAGAQAGRELGSAAKAGLKAGAGKLQEAATGVKRDASQGSRAAKAGLGLGRALGRIGQAAVGSEPTIGRPAKDTGPGVRGVQQRFTPTAKMYKEMPIEKSTDIFKRLLTAEAPDETWTGERKEAPITITGMFPK